MIFNCHAGENLQLQEASYSVNEAESLRVCATLNASAERIVRATLTTMQEIESAQGIQP